MTRKRVGRGVGWLTGRPSPSAAEAFSPRAAAEGGQPLESPGAAENNRRIEYVDAPILVGSPSSSSPRHHRLILVRQGAARIAGEPQRIVLPRSAILIPPGVFCRLETGPDAQIVQLAFCRSVLEPELLGSAADGVLGIMGAAEKAAAKAYSVRVIRLPPEAFDEAFSMCRRIETESRERPIGFEAMQRLKLMELLVLLSRLECTGGSRRPARPGPFAIDEVVRYIRDHYSDELSLPGLASRFGLNPSYLSHAFARHRPYPGNDGYTPEAASPLRELQKGLGIEYRLRDGELRARKAAWESRYTTRSRPFDPPQTGKTAVKVINHDGDEVMKVYGVTHSAGIARALGPSGASADLRKLFEAVSF